MESMESVVLLAIISNAFWLTIFLVSVVFFRSEIRALLNSLNSISIAGSHFELGDKKTTLKSFTILSNIFLDLLCDSSKADKLAEVFSEVNAQQLSKFTIKYLLEAPKEEINLPLIRNIAYIAGRRGSLLDSLSLYSFLIEKAPNDHNLQNDMGIVLLNTDPREAKKVYEKLKNDYPGIKVYKYNYALTNITLGNYDEGIRDLEDVIRDGYLDANVLNRPAIEKLDRDKPDEYRRLLALVDEEKQKRQKLA